MIGSGKAATQTRSRDVWEVRRKIRVPSLREGIDTPPIERALAGVDGVRRVSVDPAKPLITVDYLVTKTDYHAIERALGAAGYPPATGRWARFKSGWYQNLDLTGRDNATAPAPACCNRPPGGGAR
ncbi:MAG: heavy-metal-associated domain-containing protein [Bdellovibrio bacteriovorus]